MVGKKRNKKVRTIRDTKVPAEEEIKQLLIFYAGGTRKLLRKYVRALDDKEVTAVQRLGGYETIVKLLLKGSSKDLDADTAKLASDEELQKIAQRAAKRLG